MVRAIGTPFVKVFSFCSWFLKEPLCHKSERRVFVIQSQIPFIHTWLHVNEVIFGKLLDKHRMEAGCQENQPYHYRVKTFSTTFWLLVEKKVLEVELITKANDVINYTYIMKLPSKFMNYRVQRTSQLVNTWRCWEKRHPERPWKLHTPMCFSYVSLPYGCSWIIN